MHLQKYASPSSWGRGPLVNGITLKNAKMGRESRFLAKAARKAEHQAGEKYPLINIGNLVTLRVYSLERYCLN